jgi:hypothetical protein
MSLYYPSFLLYNGSNATGNLEIVHTSVKDQSMLVVIIPITISGETTKASNLITNIINSVSSSAPNSGENVTLNLSDFTLQDIVPKSPFYSTTLFFKCILYDLDNAITITQTTYNTWSSINSTTSGTESPSQLATAQSSSANSGEILSLFYNSKGPNNSHSHGDDDIYISCKPTGNSEEQQNVSFTKEKNDTTTFNTDLSSLFKNPYFIYFFYALVFVILLVFLSMIINMISSSHPIKIPFMSRKKS